MKFIFGIVIGFTVAHMEGFAGVVGKLADGLEIIADKLHERVHPDEETGE